MATAGSHRDFHLRIWSDDEGKYFAQVVGSVRSTLTAFAARMLAPAQTEAALLRVLHFAAEMPVTSKKMSLARYRGLPVTTRPGEAKLLNRP